MMEHLRVRPFVPLKTAAASARGSSTVIFSPRIHWRLFVGVAVAVAAACASPPEKPPSPAVETRRETTLGSVVGAVAESGADVWRAIPYAAPPVGDLRWRAPRPAAAWSGDRLAVAPGARCPQITSPLNRIKGKKPGTLIGAEDCLTLDVYAPKDALARAALLPVMVWIHGGSNVWGGADQYDGARLAANENVVVVVVQYRLGVLGYLSHPLLRAAATAPDDAAANFGVLDLVAALAFVRDNAAAFGGDPAQVTIFGESAGGHNVATLLTAPQAKGLFSRAIIQSGSFDSVPAADAEGAKAATRDLPNTAHDVASALGAATAEALRAASLEAVFKTLVLTSSGYLEAPTIIEDGVVVPAEGLRARVATGAPLNAVSVMTGTNKDEIKLFQIADPKLTRVRFGVSYRARDQALYDANSDYMSRIWRVRSVDGPAAGLAASGAAVYAYRFDWDDGGTVLGTDTAKLLGAAHAMEIPFVFNRFRLFGSLDRALFKKDTAADREVLSRQMGGWWAAFARDGAPGDAGGKGPVWPQWSENGGTLMRLDSPRGGGSAAFSDTESMARILADMKKDQRLDEARRCAIAKGAVEFNAEVSDSLIAALGCR